MIRELILFRPFFSVLLLLSFSPFCTYEPTSQIHPRKAFYWNAQPQKELLRSTGFGESPNKYRLAKWIAKRIACWNIWYQQALLATTTFAFEHLQSVNYTLPKLKPQLKICCHGFSFGVLAKFSVSSIAAC